MLDRVANVCVRLGISANTLTTIGMLTGVAAALLVLSGYTIVGIDV